MEKAVKEWDGHFHEGCIDVKPEECTLLCSIRRTDKCKDNFQIDSDNFFGYNYS